MSSVPNRAVPIAAPNRPSGKGGRVMQSSLDLIFSYSRSQQMRYGKLQGSAPSFVDPLSRSLSSPSDYGSVRRRRPAGPGSSRLSISGGQDAFQDLEAAEEGDGYEDGDEDEEDYELGDEEGGSEDDVEGEQEGQSRRSEASRNEERRRSSDIPLVFPVDTPPPTSPAGLEASVATLKQPSRIDSLPPSSSGRHQDNVGRSLLQRYSPNPSTIPLGTSHQSNQSQSSESSILSGARYASQHSQQVKDNPQSLPAETIQLEEEAVDEATPLVANSVERRVSRRLSIAEPLFPLGENGLARRRSSGLGRRSSSVSRKGSVGRRGSVRSRRRSFIERGESTDGQTLFNAVAVLVGIGLLSQPLAFSYAGWIGGTIMLVIFAGLTCHTAKLLARLITADPRMRGYTDIGRSALGSWAGGAINVLFCLELFALGIALIVLFGDSLNVLYPSISASVFKLISFLIVLPTALMPLRLLSLPSLLSTVSTFFLVLIILIDGVSKPNAPGSLRDPQPTNWGPELTGMNWLGGIGLVLAGFGGHAVVPSLARDMRHPERFDKVITKAFIIATGISFIAGAAGYLMIGNGVSDEITRDLMQDKYHYPRWLNIFALWMIVINPVTKFGLCSRPLNVTIETLLGISSSVLKPLPPSSSGVESYSDHSTSHLSNGVSKAKSTPDASAVSAASNALSGLSATTDSSSAEEVAEYQRWKRIERRKLVCRVITRTIVTGAVVAAAIYLPGFGRVMAFLGSFSAFLICIILPLLFHLYLAPRLGVEADLSPVVRQRDRAAHWVTVGVSVCFMIAGTTWAFIPGAGHGGLEE